MNKTSIPAGQRPVANAVSPLAQTTHPGGAQRPRPPRQPDHFCLKTSRTRGGTSSSSSSAAPSQTAVRCSPRHGKRPEVRERRGERTGRGRSQKPPRVVYKKRIIKTRFILHERLILLWLAGGVKTQGSDWPTRGSTSNQLTPREKLLTDGTNLTNGEFKDTVKSEGGVKFLR